MSTIFSLSDTIDSVGYCCRTATKHFIAGAEKYQPFWQRQLMFVMRMEAQSYLVGDCGKTYIFEWFNFLSRIEIISKSISCYDDRVLCAYLVYKLDSEKAKQKINFTLKNYENFGYYYFGLVIANLNWRSDKRETERERANNKIILYLISHQRSKLHQKGHISLTQIIKLNNSQSNWIQININRTKFSLCYMTKRILTTYKNIFVICV